MAQTVYCSYADESWYFSAQIRRVAAATTVYIRSESCTACTCAVQGESRRRDSNLQRGREAEARARVFTAQIFTNATCMHADGVPPVPPGWLANGWIGFIQMQQKSDSRSAAAVNWPARSIVSYRCRCRQLFPGPFHASSCSAAFVCLFVVLLLSAGCSVAAVHLPPVMRCRAGAAACKTKLTPFTGRSVCR